MRVLRVDHIFRVLQWVVFAQFLLVHSSDTASSIHIYAIPSRQTMQVESQ